MIDGGEKRNRQLVFELRNSHVCEKRSKAVEFSLVPRRSFLIRCPREVWERARASNSR